MSKHYNHLSAEERAVVQIEIQDGKGPEPRGGPARCGSVQRH